MKALNAKHKGEKEMGVWLAHTGECVAWQEVGGGSFLMLLWSGVDAIT